MGRNFVNYVSGNNAYNLYTETEKEKDYKRQIKARNNRMYYRKQKLMGLGCLGVAAITLALGEILYSGVITALGFFLIVTKQKILYDGGNN